MDKKDWKKLVKKLDRQIMAYKRRSGYAKMIGKLVDSELSDETLVSEATRKACHLSKQTEQTMGKDKVMKEKGKTITESIKQGTPMGKMLGGWTGNQAEVDKAVQSKQSDKSLTCDALDAYYKLARGMEKQEPSACRLPKYNEFRKGVGKRCRAYKVVSAASERAMKEVKGCRCTLQDFNDVTVSGIDPEKVTIHRVGRYFEARVVLEGSVEWPGFSNFTTCFLSCMRTLLGREVIVDKICLGRIYGFISIQFRFAEKAKSAKKRR